MTLIWSLILALHLLAMAFWLGGALFAILIAPRIVGVLETNQRHAVLLQAWTRFYRGVWHVFGLSVATGIALILHDGGFGGIPLPVDIMMGLGLIMGGWSVLVARGPLTRARRAVRPQPAQLVSVRRQTMGIVGLGVATLLAASLAHGF